MSEKIRPEHLQRAAYVYIRQSTTHQVRFHLEGQKRQYGLGERARGLGFARVVVQKLSAEFRWTRYSEQRYYGVAPGYQEPTRPLTPVTPPPMAPPPPPPWWMRARRASKRVLS